MVTPKAKKAVKVPADMKVAKEEFHTPGNKSNKVMGIEKTPKAQTGMCKE